MKAVFDKIIELLKTNNINFESIHHEATPTSEDSARVRGDDLSQGAKAILYKVQDEYALFVFAADKRMNPKLIKNYFKMKGKKAKKTRFASSEELMNLTGLIPGSVPPFGEPILPFDLYVDPSLLSNTIIAFNAGSITDSIKMSLRDYQDIANPEVFEFCH
jgi:prolyl-tRNA editing enzyme YbaK/EbsC (Cys-tRNA(Pro) deacylase)